MKAVEEVREWRRKVMEGWAGKTPAEIRDELNAFGSEFQEQMRMLECRRRQRKGVAAPE